jgi:hypothetical protein
MEQLIRIVQKSLIRLDVIFESNLVALRSMGFKGYQGLFPDFLAALRVKKSNYDDAGKVEVNINNPVVGQLWDEVMGLLAFTRSVMVPFLKVFGVVEGHSLSPFAVKIDTPQDLRQIIIQYFKTPKKITSTVINQNVTSIEDDCKDDNEDDVNVGDTVEGMSDSVLANHVTEIEIQEDSDDMDGGDGLLSFENELSST